MVLTGALLAGCAAGEHHSIDIKEAAVAEREAIACPVLLVELIDSVGPRVNRGSSGSSYQIDGLPEHIQLQITSWQPTGGQTGEQMELSLELARTYSQLKNPHVYFDTVLIATLPERDREIIRGKHRVVNWFGSESEFRRAVRHSLDDALDNLHEYLTAECSRSG